MASSVMTVCGPLAADLLGTTSMHDHVLAVLGPFFRTQQSEADRATCPIDVDAKVAMADLSYLNRAGLRGMSSDNWDLTDAGMMQGEVRHFRERGGMSILEPSAPGIRTDIAAVRMISRQTGVNIVASTGLYVRDSWPARFHAMDEKDFAGYLRREIGLGIDDTDIRAGHIKTAIRRGDPDELRFIRPVVQVSNDTNLLVTAHTSGGTEPQRREAMLAAFLEQGMNPAKLLFCHLQFTFLRADPVEVLMHPEKHHLSLDWAKQIMDRGANICIDLFGSPSDAQDHIRIAGLLSLLRAGYASQIVVGNDVYQKTLTRACGGFGYAGILDYMVPTLRDHGITEEVIHRMLVENPARLLGT